MNNLSILNRVIDLVLMKTRKPRIEKRRRERRDTRRLSNLLTSNELLPFSANFNPSN